MGRNAGRLDPVELGFGRAIGYTRVSTEDQADSGAGLAAQRHAIEGKARAMGLPLAGMYEDAGLSAALPPSMRPGLTDAIGSLERRDALIVYDRSRLARGMELAMAIERVVTQAGAWVLSCAGEGSGGNDPADVLVRRIADAFNEFERLQISSRTKAAMRALRREGKRYTLVPVAYGERISRRTGRPIRNNKQMKIVESILEARDSEKLSFGKIAKRLNSRGSVPPVAKKWNRESVRRIYNRFSS